MTTTRSKALGTAAESATVKTAIAAGLSAHRTALAAGHDVGDVHIDHGRIVVQVKAGKAAETASQALCAAWWAETEVQADRVSQCDLAVLLVKRRGVGNPRGWRAFVRVGELLWLLYAAESESRLVVEMSFGALLDAYLEVR